MPIESLDDFEYLLVEFQKALFQDNEPVACQLLNDPRTADRLTFVDDQDNVLWEELHSAAACNLASLLSSLHRLLLLGTSDECCADLQVPFILSCDVFRETLFHVVKGYNPEPVSKAERMLGLWAGHLKHPVGSVYAHKCFDDVETEGYILVNCEYLATIDNEANGQYRKKDKEKNQLKNKIVFEVLPSKELFSEFFVDSRARIDKMLTP